MTRGSEGVLLIVSHTADEYAGGVARALRNLGWEVIVSPDPLVDPYACAWQLGSPPFADTNSWDLVPRSAREIEAVFVRGACASVQFNEWTASDSAYVQSERQAALLAWLWGLRCPVINRPTPDIWFRPRRSYPEWRAMFAACGLPTAAICITNRIDSARDWARRWAGRATYAPITSSARYAMEEPAQWDGLGTLSRYVPVCLLPPCAARPFFGTFVGGRVVWDADVPADVAALEPGLLRLVTRLGLDFLQIEVARDDDGLHCLSADPHPVIARQDGPARVAIIERLVELLIAAQGRWPSAVDDVEERAHSGSEVSP